MELGSFRINGVRSGGCWGKLGSFRFLARTSVRGLNIGVAGLRRAVYLMVVFLALVSDSPCFWCCFVLKYATHYTMLFDICQMLNEINRGYLPQKGTKGIWWTGNRH